MKKKGIDPTKIYGDIDKIVKQNAHYLDLSEGGTLFVAPSKNSNADLSKYIGAQGIKVSSQEITGMLNVGGAGLLTFTGDSGATTKFSGGLFVQGGEVNVATNAIYSGLFQLKNGKFTALNGTQTFNTDVSMNQSQMDITSAPESKKTFNLDVYVSEGSTLYSWGNVAYNQTVGIDQSLAVFSGVVPGLSSGNTTWGAKSQLNIYGGSLVYANANCVDVDLVFGGQGGVLHYLNVDKNNADRATSNQFYVTLDEKQTPTVLKWTAGSANIAKALENNNLITHNVISYDASTQLYISTMGLAEANNLGEVNGYTVVFNNAEGKKFDYAGMTLVDNAFMVVQGDTNFGTKTDKTRSNFGVFGEAYLKIDKETWEVQGSGMLGFDRDDASATSAPSITANLVHFRSGVVMVSLKDFTSVCIRHLQDIIDNTDPANLDTWAAIAESQDRAYEEYKSNSHIGGSRIWLDTTFNGQYASENDKTFKLGAINADKITFASDTQIWYDGISTKPSDVKMTFDLNAPTIEYAVVSDELTMEPSKGISNFYDITRKTIERKDAEGNDVPTTVGDIEDLFGRAVLVDAKYELAAAPANDAAALTEEGRRAQRATAGTVTVTAKSVGQYAESQNMSAKERELAGKIDESRLSMQGGKSTEFYDALYNETDESNVRQTIHNLSLLGYTMLNSQGHFGNPTSSFFGGASISGGAKRGQERQEDWAAETNQPEQKSEIAKERNDYNPTRGLWAAYTHTSVDGEDYEFGGVTTHGYKLRRDGIIGGIRRQIDATTSAGLFFGISTPEVASSARLNAGNQIPGNGYGVVSSSMEMTDFQYAVHFEKVFADAWELAAYVGGGTQAMEWERRADLRDSDSGMYKYTADGSGNTFTGTLYLSYRADVNDALTLRPTIGVDTEHS